MSSWVFFKFKSSKEPTRITFDGTGITVFELKREIINVSRLGDGTDFDLVIYDENTNEEYDDDTAIIPRSSLVIARRLPAARAGHGRAARYVSGRMPVHAKRHDKMQATSDAQAALDNAKTEEDKLAAMHAIEAEQWQKTKQEMALAKAVAFKGQKKPNQSDKPPPKNYSCHRCGSPDHWIQDCPTWNDPDFVLKPRLKKTTGIPRSFLQKVDKTDMDDDEAEAKGYMLDAEGNRVRVKADTATWEKEQARQKVAAASKQAAEQENKELLELGLECPIDHRLFEVPTKTPCCSKTYCYQCIEDALIENDLVCPNCGKEVLIDALLPDNDMALKIKAYRDEKTSAETKAKEAVQEAEAAAAAEVLAKQAEAEKAAKEAKEAKAAEEAERKSAEIIVESTESNEEQSKSGTDTNNNANQGSGIVTRSRSKAPITKSPSPAASNTSQNSKVRASSTESSAKKRPAEDDLQSERVPKAPAAMRKQQEEQQKSQDMTPQFLKDMEKLSKGDFQAFMNQNPMASMPMGMNIPNAMAMPPAGPTTMMGNPAMMNAMMQNPAWMAQMNGMNMMNMANFPNGGFNNQGYQNYNQNWQNNQQQNQQWNNNHVRGGYNNFNSRGRGRGNFQQNQQQQQQHHNFNRQNPNEEDSAYFRQPVNPNRHQRGRKMRPLEFTEVNRR